MVDVTGHDRLRTAIVGAGFIGPHHIDAVQRGGYADVVVLVDRDPDRGPVTARALGVPHAVTDLDAVLGDPTIESFISVRPIGPMWIWPVP